ncbi:MAG: fibronectin type III domain-containing protein [Propionibacteriaceae bacterium]|nr:fibronectin type III domain-containing protein [Propionibacteriaceae bacterium]
MKVKKATVGTKQVTFTWTKAPTAKADWGEKSLSYQIRYRVKGTTKWTKVKVSLSKASYTIKKLKKGKKYQIGIRVKLQVTGGDMGIFYGPWSKTLTSGKVK